MNKFKELLFISSIKEQNIGKVFINNHLKEIKKLNDYNDCILFLNKHNKFISQSEKKYICNKIDNEINYIKNNDIKIITVLDEDYPNSLNDLDKNRPLIIYAKGNHSLLTSNSMAIIGTRSPSKQSIKFEKAIIEKIPEVTDYTIVSGLALGCDKIAHETTVNMNKTTIAVLPNGIDLITPFSHKKLAKDIIAKNGCLISIHPIGTKPQNYTYLERDDIVAALANLVFVIECGVKSGTLRTVETAHKLKKNIGCYVPSNNNEGDFTGNNYILSKKSGVSISSKEELLSFLKLKDLRCDNQLNLF